MRSPVLCRQILLARASRTASQMVQFYAGAYSLIQGAITGLKRFGLLMLHPELVEKWHIVLTSRKWNCKAEVSNLRHIEVLEDRK